MLPQQAARWQLLAIGALLAISIMGPLCTACDERKDIILTIFKIDRAVEKSKSFHEQIWIAGCRFSHKMV